MPFLPIVLVVEIILATLTVNIGSLLQTTSQQYKNKDYVLGVELAQEISPSSSETSTSPATDDQSNPTTVPLSQGSPAENTTQPESSSNTQSPYSSPSPDNPNLFSDIFNPSAQPTGSELVTPTGETQNTSDNQLPAPEITSQPTSQETVTQPNPSENVSPATSFEPSATPAETYANQIASVLNPSDFLNSQESINQQAIDEAKTEDEQIRQVSDPGEQTKLLISFAVDKVKDINNSIKNDDFASTNFASQRFDADIDRAVANLQNLPPDQSKQLKKQLINFCTQADFILRSAELSVPEEVEQDLEINRAKCLNIGQ